MEQAWSYTYNLYQTNSEGWNIALGALVVAIILSFMWRMEGPWESDILSKRRGKMLRRARREFVRRDAIDAFVDYVEERVFHGDYTRKEANELYRDARKYWPVKELFPSPELLKENIRKRLDATGRNQPVPLPDREEKARPKHMFEKPAKA